MALAVQVLNDFIVVLGGGVHLLDQTLRCLRVAVAQVEHYGVFAHQTHENHQHPGADQSWNQENNSPKLIFLVCVTRCVVLSVARQTWVIIVLRQSQSHTKDQQVPERRRTLNNDSILSKQVDWHRFVEHLDRGQLDYAHAKAVQEFSDGNGPQVDNLGQQTCGYGKQLVLYENLLPPVSDDRAAVLSPEHLADLRAEVDKSIVGSCLL